METKRWFKGLRLRSFKVFPAEYPSLVRGKQLLTVLFFSESIELDRLPESPKGHVRNV